MTFHPYTIPPCTPVTGCDRWLPRCESNYTPVRTGVLRLGNGAIYNLHRKERQIEWMMQYDVLHVMHSYRCFHGLRTSNTSTKFRWSHYTTSDYAL